MRPRYDPSNPPPPPDPERWLPKWERSDAKKKHKKKHRDKVGRLLATRPESCALAGAIRRAALNVWGFARAGSWARGSV